MVVDCRVRLHPLLWPLILWTGIFALWVGHLPPHPGLVACCLMARCSCDCSVLVPVVLSFMKPTAPSFTMVLLVVPDPFVLPLVWLSWRVFESLSWPLPLGAGASTFDINTCDGVLTAF